jgi:hydroxymethylbilane synthase
LKEPPLRLRHDETWLAVHAERAVARTLGGSCSTPLGAFATFDATATLTVRAVLGDAAPGATLDEPGRASPPVGAPIRHVASAKVTDIHEAEQLGIRVAQALLDSGGRGYLPIA